MSPVIKVVIGTCTICGVDLDNGNCKIIQNQCDTCTVNEAVAGFSITDDTKIIASSIIERAEQKDDKTK